MNPTLTALGVAVILIVAVLAWLYVQRRRSTTTAELKQRFEREYEPAKGEHGSERRAEAELEAREKRADTLAIRDLDRVERAHFSDRWRALQSGFVDDPKGAVTEADALVSLLMQTRGYPVADFHERAADISVDHPRVVANHRSWHEIALRLGNGDGTTEDLRTAMIDYRSLVDELVQVPTVVGMKEVA